MTAHPASNKVTFSLRTNPSLNGMKFIFLLFFPLSLPSREGHGITGPPISTPSSTRMSTPTLACKHLTYRLPDGVPTTSTSPLLDKLKHICSPSDPRWMGKKLLSNISFEISPSTMTALMGPSGAGKSTLLDVLAERKIEGTLFGEQVGHGSCKGELQRIHTIYGRG